MRDVGFRQAGDSKLNNQLIFYSEHEFDHHEQKPLLDSPWIIPIYLNSEHIGDLPIQLESTADFEISPNEMVKIANDLQAEMRNHARYAYLYIQGTPEELAKYTGRNRNTNFDFVDRRVHTVLQRAWNSKELAEPYIQLTKTPAHLTFRSPSTPPGASRARKTLSVQTSSSLFPRLKKIK
tara:strand:+ start:1359 stop:1898 length:540 start_codon:yes stop_codon:yes gene_type:complete